MWTRLIPGLSWMRSYRPEWFSGDLFAGLTVGVMLIPQGMAYAMIAGLPPIYGLYASTVPLVVYSLFGTSRQLAVGPVALVALLVSTGVGAMAEPGSEQFIALAVLLALMVGALQASMGLFRLGFLVNFLSHPVISGFTSGAALIIGFSQLKHLLGISLPSSQQLPPLIHYLATHLGQLHGPTLAVGLGGIAIIVLGKRLDPRLPGPLLAVVAGIVAVHFFNLGEHGIKVIGEVPSGLPAAAFPHWDWTAVQALLPTALTISLISFMESYAVARAIQRRHRDYTIDANRELLALGLANAAGSLFQAHPTTGGFSRTAVNDQAGAKTGLAAIISAALVALTLLFLTPLFRELPQAVLASIILVAVYGLIDFKEVRYLLRSDRRDLVMLLATFLGTVTLGVEAGILTGLLLSLADLIYRSSRPHYAVLGAYGKNGIYRNIERFPEVQEHPGMLILRPDAQWFFANVSFWQQVLRERLAERPDTRVLILHGPSIPDMDSSGLHLLSELLDECRQQDMTLRLSGLIGPVRDKLDRCGFFDRLGRENVFMTLGEAVSGAPADHDAQQGAVRTGKHALT